MKGMAVDSGFYTLAQAADFLNISVATLKNWNRQRILKIENHSPGPVVAKQNLLRLRRRMSKTGRLTSRANKSRSGGYTDPVELLNDSSQARVLKKIRAWAPKKELLLAVYLVQLKKNGVSLNAKIKSELANWGVEFEKESFVRLIKKIESCPLDWSDSLLSYLHQYLHSIGARNKKGSYFTPMQTVEELVGVTVKKTGTFCDPCCGSGHFLLAAARRLDKLGTPQAWGYVYGYDLDLLSVLVARAQLSIYSKGESDSVRQIQLCDSLLLHEGLNFDYVLTNPPWGAGLKNKKHLQERYGDYADSFAYFTLACAQLASARGRVSLILPESFLGVAKYHRLRQRLLATKRPIAVRPLGRLFAGVFTGAIVLELGPVRQKQSSAEAFAITSPQQKKLIQAMEKNANYVLKEGAVWALGVVTGDNARFLKIGKKKSYTEILRGRDIAAFRCEKPGYYIDLKSPRLQQKADLSIYAAKPKLVYRFIGRDLSFAIERKGYATLNSANIILPRHGDYSLEVLCGILNSEPARAYYRAKFNSLKVLRQHLENFPFPAFERRSFKKIETLVRQLENKYSLALYSQLNAVVTELYGL
jgi:methylase of polypeptide subunit release factors